MDAQEAATAGARIKPKLAIPMHWLKADPNAFQRALSAIDPTIEVVVPATGQTVFNSG